MKKAYTRFYDKEDYVFPQELFGQDSTWRPKQAETEMFGEEVFLLHFGCCEYK